MKPPSSPNLKAQVLIDLDSDREVIIESKYIPMIWGSEELLSTWCDSWNLTYSIAAGFVQRERFDMKFPIYWCTIKRLPSRAEVDTTEEPDELTTTEPERSELTDETDAGI